MTPPADERLTGWRFLLFSVALAVGNVIALSNVPGYTVLVPYAAGSLQGVNPSFGTWATTDHMMGIVLGLPLARWFSGRYRRSSDLCRSLRRLCALLASPAPRARPSGSSCPCVSCSGWRAGSSCRSARRSCSTKFRRTAASIGVAWWGVLSMAPFTLGVFMGGFWAEYVSWRMLFYSNILLGLPIAGLVAALFYGRPNKRKILRFDTVGFILITVVLVGVQTILNQGNDFDWFGSPILGAVLIAVIVALPAFVVWELGERNPVLDIRLFRHRNYAVGVFCSIAGFLVIQGTLSVFVGQLQTLLGYTSSLAGVVYLTMAVFAAPFVSIIHLMVRHVDLRYFAMLNFIGFAVTLTWLGEYDKVASFDQITTPMLFFGFFLATFFAPPAAIAVQGLAGAKLIRAAEELAMLRTAFGAYGITSQAVVQFRRAPVHQLGMADHLGGREYPSLDVLGALTRKLQDLGLSEAVSNAQIARLMRQQALLLGLDDAFYFGALVFVVLAGIIWLRAVRRRGRRESRRSPISRPRS